MSVQQELYGKYGYVILPKGFKLYHTSREGFDSTNNEQHNNTLFCSIGDRFGNKDKVYEVELLQDLKILLAVSKFKRRCYLASALPEIARDYSLGIDTDPIGIKMNETNRDQLIEFFRSNCIVGWLGPVEEKIDIEVCLFPDSLEKMVSVTLIEDDKYNSLDYSPCWLVLGTGNRVSEGVFDSFWRLYEDYLRDPAEVGAYADMTRILHANGYLFPTVIVEERGLRIGT
jgi:hypothetical protein